MKLVFSLFAIISVCAASASANAQKPMSLVDFINIEDIREPRLAPDGKHILFLRRSSHWKQNKRIGNIWLVDRDGENMRQLTNSDTGESTPRWSPDANRIAFIDKRGDDNARQIYIVPIDGGEGQRLTNHETDVSKIMWSADGERIYFIAAEPDTPEEKKRIKQGEDIFPYDEHYKQKHLWSVNIESGDRIRVTKGDFTVRDYHIAADTGIIAYSRARTPLLNDMFSAEVWTINTDGSGHRQLTVNNAQEDNVRLSPDGKYVLFTSSVDKLEDVNYAAGEAYYNNNIFVMETSGGTARMLQRDMPYDVDSAEWSSDGKSIYITANTGVRDQLFRINVRADTMAQITEGDHSFAGWHYQPARNVHALSIATAKNPGDISTINARGAVRRVTHIFDSLADSLDLPDVKAIQWQGKDGVTVEGLLYYPSNYTKDQRYPLVVQTHGGPSSSDQFGNFSSTYFMQPLTSRGYAVLKTNHRGSTGYGDDFMRDMVGGYFNQAHHDVMNGVDHVIDMGIADPDRLVKMGWSAGGHMTNKLITYTNRFKAAASGAGAVNWISMVAQSDIRLWREAWFGGSPWQENAPLDAYLEHSPLKDIAKVQTPTLILVGGKDVRVPPAQSIAMYHALKSNDVETKLYIAPREPHGWRELRHQLFRINVQLEWFARHALGQEYIWEAAPALNAEEDPVTIVVGRR